MASLSEGSPPKSETKYQEGQDPQTPCRWKLSKGCRRNISQVTNPSFYLLLRKSFHPYLIETSFKLLATMVRKMFSCHPVGQHTNLKPLVRIRCPIFQKVFQQVSLPTNVVPFYATSLPLTSANLSILVYQTTSARRSINFFITKVIKVKEKVKGSAAYLHRVHKTTSLSKQTEESDR